MIERLIQSYLKQQLPELRVKALHGKENSAGELLAIKATTNGHDPAIDQDKTTFRIATVQIGIHGYDGSTSHDIATQVIDAMTDMLGDFTSLIEGYNVRAVEWMNGPLFVRDKYWTVNFEVHYRVQ